MARVPNPTDIKRLSGLSPLDHKPDDPKRFDLFNRLRRFYNRFDAVRVTTGLGAIVDWALRNGEDALNQRLLLKYGENLQTMEEFERKLQEEGRGGEERDSTQAAPPKRAPTMREKIRDFYEKHDPKKLEEGIDKYVEYVQLKGIDALNSKLMKKYGACLDMSDVEVVNQRLSRGGGSRGSFAAFYTTITKEEDQEKDIEGSRKTSSLSESRKTADRSEGPPKVSRQKSQPKKLFKLPEEFVEMLHLFYAVYDPLKLTNGQVDVVVHWTRKHGIPKLNEKLDQKYRESYDKFVGRANAVRDELIEFYTKVDKRMLVKGLDEVLKWCLRNGRRPLNEKLRAKYGRDLDSDKFGAPVYEDEEPAF